MVSITTLQIIQIAAASGLFLFVWWALRKFIFIPYLAVLEEREARTVGDVERARVGEQEIITVTRVIEEELREARVEGIKRREERARAAKAAAQETIDKAAERASAELEKSREMIAALERQAEEQIQSHVAELAQQIVTNVFSEKGGSRVLH